MPVTNITCVNGLGLSDRMMERLNTKEIKPISRRLVICGSGSKVFGTGKHRKVKLYKGQLAVLQKEFDDKHKEIKDDAVLASQEKADLYAKRKLDLLKECKKHGGPFTSGEDVKMYLEDCRKDQKRS